MEKKAKRLKAIADWINNNAWILTYTSSLSPDFELSVLDELKKNQLK